jgi:hypothetical protein
MHAACMSPTVSASKTVSEVCSTDQQHALVLQQFTCRLHLLHTADKHPVHLPCALAANAAIAVLCLLLLLSPTCCSFAEGSERTFGSRAYDRVRNTQIGQPKVGPWGPFADWV